MINFYKVSGVSFDKQKMKLSINNQKYEFDLAKISPRLLRANQEERNNFEISPSGYGIRWPLIDEDLSIDGLLKFVK
ncbi:MAG: DUF2442 domain-containing protein [Candidatus Omnitrophica bacterium]|nr:DUF2442 domain-containing protein [Candidatus Omnitrophota bacterium]